MRAASSFRRVQARTSICTSSSRQGFSSCPRKRFATTSRFSHSARSWKTVAIPISSALAGVSSETGRPMYSMAPSVGWWTPASTLTSVDFPAPLSPTSATTSPAWTSSSMSVSAETAPKRFETPRKDRMRSPFAGSLSRACMSSPPMWSPGPRAGTGPWSNYWVIPKVLQPSAYSPVQICSGVLMPLSKISALMFSAVTTAGTKSSDGVL